VDSQEQDMQAAKPTPRLAELVMHLSGCGPEQAVRTVDAALESEPEAAAADPLVIVARALVALRRVDLRDRVDIREQPQHVERTKPVA
jgi:hypothetical protein